ncbi:hypothetical protein DQ392_31325 [Streptomyces reniochalinae]|uniref:Uncharacterized protein n=1 Tax=Streptomyces reniochalinae TaxID=2250578 RepID=A0A367E763_9ACTN|nr:hypothetical protein DQ392_31325 [Streptomyces reniochalinae]
MPPPAGGQPPPGPFCWLWACSLFWPSGIRGGAPPGPPPGPPIPPLMEGPAVTMEPAFGVPE